MFFANGGPVTASGHSMGRRRWLRRSNHYERVLPPEVDPEAWRDAVDQTRAMLLTVTGSNLLDVNAMDALRNELAQHVRQASEKPSTALNELAEIWNEAADRGEFLFRDSRSQSGRRHPRPKLIPSYAETRVLPAMDSLRSIAPPDVDPGAWREAIDETRAMLLAVTEASSFDVAKLRTLRERLLHQVNQARDRPQTALDALAAIWDEVAPPARSQRPRPKILPPPRGELSHDATVRPVR